MRLKMPAAIAIMLSMIFTVSCSHKAEPAQTAAEAATDSDAYTRAMTDMEAACNVDSLRSPADSLSYYLGVMEGVSYRRLTAAIPENVRHNVTVDDYRLGIYTVLAADTAGTSYATGLMAGRRLSRYLNDLEARGVKFNRQRLVSTLMKALSEPPADPHVKAEADSIANTLIQRQI